jgi:signal transduction histidine kinase
MQQQTAQVAGVAEINEGINEIGPAAAGLATMGATGTGVAGKERQRVEAVVETLANLRGEGESLAEVAHDARNMVTALGLYCDLLEEPGVLYSSYTHYASELRLVASASRRLVEKLLSLDLRLGAAVGLPRMGSEPGSAPLGAVRPERARRWDLMPAAPINNLAAELLANRNLLAALAGAAISLTVDAKCGALPVQMNGEELTRILVNLVKNAAEAMPEGGSIRLSLGENPAKDSLTLTVEDDGPGIPANALEKIFDSGYSTNANKQYPQQAGHRGLGLSITRSIVEAAGGSIHAANRSPRGARFEITLPLRSR